MPIKKSKLEKINEEFSRLEKILKFEESKETKRLAELKEYIRLYMISPYEGCIKIYQHFNLNPRRYPDNNIINETIKPQIRYLLEFFKPKITSLQGNLFTQP